MLDDLLQQKRAAIQMDASGVAPEQVVVFETNGPIRDFHDLVSKTPGLEWLVDDELQDLAPDEDFFVVSKPDKTVGATLYFVMFDQQALGQILRLWRMWRENKRLPPNFRAWRDVFGRLRDVRPWGVLDRLRETRVLDAWRARIAAGYETVTVEIELWFRHAQQRSVAARRVGGLVSGAGGQVIGESAIEAIAYHGLLARLPISVVEQILDNPEVALLQCDEMRLLRPTGQAREPLSAEDAVQEISKEISEEKSAPTGEPVVALLDGLPLENHALLAGRLVVDDPDGWAETYPVKSRRHGTAMASLILHGDQNAHEPANARRLYVRPILRPAGLDDQYELVPDELLLIDLLHRAVRRVVEGDGQQRAASPGVCIFNLSIGDPFQPFVRAMSPVAKLLDWLAWKYRVLFIVSAGNHYDDLQVSWLPGDKEHDRTAALLKVLADKHRHHRLLSPAESMNALTVGATHDDCAGQCEPRDSEEQMFLLPDGVPSPISAFGRGFRRTVKPDLLAPGGRVVFIATPDEENETATLRIAARPRFPPGQKVAAPSTRSGDVRGFHYTAGTSNAAALTTRLAEQIHDALDELRDETNAQQLAAVPIALWIKTLLVHGGSWSQEAYDLVAQVLRHERNQRTFDDEVAAILGYGRLQGDRVLACAAERVTVLGGGSIGADETLTHTLPLPASLNAHTAWRRLTITLSWFTPINAQHRKYRRAQLFFEAPAPAQDPLSVKRADVDWQAVRRGALQHEVFESRGRAINVASDAVLRVPVTCLADAGALTDRIPYALAMTLEVGPGVNTQIYDEVRERVRSRVEVRP